jgi:hypothetical protein
MIDALSNAEKSKTRRRLTPAEPCKVWVSESCDFTPLLAQAENLALPCTMMSQPKNWSRSVAQAVRALDDAELPGNREAQAQSWINILLGVAVLHEGPV